MEESATFDREPWGPVEPEFSPWEIDGEVRHTRVTIGPEGCEEGSERPLTGVLFAYLDVVAGCPPWGPLNPTIDLRVELFDEPRLGAVRFTSRTLRLGRTLYVSETQMRQEGAEVPFGISLATFLNNPVDDLALAGTREERLAARPFPAEHYRRLTRTRHVRPGCVDLDVDLSSPQGTVGGQTLARLVEVAALDLLGPPRSHVVDELDVRFLTRTKQGPIRATARILGRPGGHVIVGVEVRDLSADDRLTTYAHVRCRVL